MHGTALRRRVGSHRLLLYLPLPSSSRSSNSSSVSAGDPVGRSVQAVDTTSHTPNFFVSQGQRKTFNTPRLQYPTLNPPGGWAAIDNCWIMDDLQRDSAHSSEPSLPSCHAHIARVARMHCITESTHGLDRGCLTLLYYGADSAPSVWKFLP